MRIIPKKEVHFAGVKMVETSLKKKATLGVLLLIIKRVLTQVVFTATNIFLARLLFPSDFGTFVIVGSVITFFQVFADLGLTPSLIQKKGRLTTGDIRTVFTMQLVLGILVTMLTFLLSGHIARFFNLGSLGMNLLRVYSLIFLIDPFRQAPTAMLERNLGYKKLVIIDLIVAFSGSLTVVTGAYWGFGVWSLVIGQVISHLVSAFMLFLLARWPLGIQLAKRNFLALVRFGLPFQTNMIFGLFYGPLIMLYLGKQVGQENLGFYQFAASLAVFSLVFSEIINRIVFPLGARAQTGKLFLKGIIEKSVSIVSMTTIPIAAIMMVSLPEIIHFVYTDKWLPALPAMYLGLAQMTIMAYTGVFGQFLLSIGKSKVMRNMGFIWALLTWILAPVLIDRFNFVGMSATSVFVSASGIWLFFKLQKEVKFQFWTNTYPYFLAAVLSALIFYTVKKFADGSIFYLLLALFSVGVVYVVLVLILRKEMLFLSIKSLVFAFRNS